MSPGRGQLLLTVLLCSFPAWSGAWTSARVYPSGSGLAYTYDAEGTRIPDFSYAGFEEGCKPLPSFIPVVMTLTPVAGDNTANINGALSAVAAMPMQANGYRGALLLKPGTYNVAGVVQLGGNGVVLRGSGSGTNPAVDSIIFSTRTDFDPTTNRGEYNVIEFGNIAHYSGGLRGTGTVVNITTPWVKVGDDSFQAANVAPFAVGDLIIITQPVTTAWLASVNYGDTAGAPGWTSGGPIVQVRRITAIDAATNTIHIAGGSFQHLKQSLGQCTIATMDKTLFAQHSGIEDLHVDITHSSATDEHHAKNAIDVGQALHGWVRNAACRYYWHSAIMVHSSMYCSIQGNLGSDFAGIVTGERAYTFSAERYSSHILFTGNAAYGGRHNYICNSGYSNSGVVFYDNDSYNSVATMEAHMHWSMGILFDNVRDYNASDSVAMGVYNRGSMGDNGSPNTAHGWACANCVIWNSLEEKQNIICQKPPTAQNYVIGCTAGKLISGAKPPAPFSVTAGYIEGTNRSGLVPASLYVAQLAARTDCPMTTPVSTPVASFTPTSTATATATRSATRTATATVTLSATSSPTAGATRTATPSSSPTATATATASPSGTSAPTGTPNLTLTPSPTPLQSATASATPTLSATPSLSLTAGASGTAGPTLSASVSASATPSRTETASGSATPTVTPSATLTTIASATPTVTPSVSRTSSPSSTLSVTPTVRLTATRSASPSASSTPSASATLPPMAKASVTPTPTFSPVIGQGGQGPLVLEALRVQPDPVHGRLLVLKLLSQGPAETLDLKLYSSAQVCVLRALLPGPPGAGWSQTAVELPGLPPGLYYLRAHLEQGDRRSPSVLGTMYLLP